MSDYDPGDSTDYDPNNPGNGLSASDPEGNAFYRWYTKLGLANTPGNRRDWQWQTGRMMDQFNLLCEEMSREEAVKRMESYGFANFESDWM
jgi:hypothetical protein